MRPDEWKGRLGVIPDCIASLFASEASDSACCCLCFAIQRVLLKLVTRGPLIEIQWRPLYKGLKYTVIGNVGQSRTRTLLSTWEEVAVLLPAESSLFDTGSSRVARDMMGPFTFGANMCRGTLSGNKYLLYGTPSKQQSYHQDVFSFSEIPKKQSHCAIRSVNTRRTYFLSSFQKRQLWAQSQTSRSVLLVPGVI